jgi:pyruvate/2-oxoglutarate dehydrogenase complex dihydrolipoamide dehydrogenase (E3) component
MIAVEHFDILVFGGGKAAKTLAMVQAKTGRRVAVIEAGMIGGSCINITCIPSKALIRSAEIAGVVAHAGSFGTTVEGAVEHGASGRAHWRSRIGYGGLQSERLRCKRLRSRPRLGTFVEPRVIEVSSERGLAASQDIGFLSTSARGRRSRIFQACLRPDR